MRVRRILFLIECGEWRRNLMWQSEDVFLKGKLYLFGEGSVILSFSFLFEDVLGTGTALLGDDSGTWYVSNVSIIFYCSMLLYYPFWMFMGFIIHFYIIWGLTY